MIPVGITAKNESLALPQFLESLRKAKAFAEKKSSFRFSLSLILNDNTDDTLKVIDQRDLKILETAGGIVEAQRRFVETEKSFYHIFTDADILLPEDALLALALEMTAPGVQVAYLEKVPVLPKRSTILAKALYHYNLNNGYQSQRRYFNGQCFAIRNWNIPRSPSFPPEANNNFLCLDQGIRCDDIYLSRKILQDFGEAAIRLVPSMLSYRPPETLQGMYRKYQRMRLEFERLDHFFPESRKTHRSLGKRKFIPATLREHGIPEFFYYAVFLFFLQLCKGRYHWERFSYSRFRRSLCPTWLPVKETKESYDLL
jgi:glycosyltransferase involved in cell wall biosynthesis